MDKILISFDNPNKKNTFKIDGVTYELISVLEYTWEHWDLIKSIDRHFKNMDAGLITDEEVDEVEQQLKTYVKKIVRNLPDEVNESLKDPQRMQILHYFQEIWKEAEKNPPSGWVAVTRTKNT